MAMQTRIEKTFAIAASADAAWQVLQDIKTVAECMPGAQITEQVDATHYKGQVKLRLGPASATFNGELEIKSLDPLSKRLEMTGKGSDIGGSSGAATVVTTPQRQELNGLALVWHALVEFCKSLFGAAKPKSG